MTAAETRPSAALPGPRTAELEPLEPWRSTRTTRPRSEYWDVENARWTTRPVIPGPRRGA